MKKILTIAAATLLAFSISSCEDQLDSINYTKQDTGNFPASSDDVVSELNGVYSVLISVGDSVFCMESDVGRL